MIKKYKYSTQYYKNLNLKRDDLIIKQITDLICMVKGSAKLDHHAIQTAINDTFIRFNQNVKEGKVDEVKGYDHYKGWLFIVAKNYVLQIFEKAKCQKIAKNSSLEDNLGVLDYSQLPTINLNQIRQVVNQLSPKERAIIRWRIRGWSLKYIGKAFGVCSQTSKKWLTKIEKQIKDKVIYIYIE
jgi:RNA polymerase sigma factor (sigma-70 family)